MRGIWIIAATAAVFLTCAGGRDAKAQQLQGWMNPEVRTAWSKGFKGRGASITVVDDFIEGGRFQGRLGGTKQTLRHGEWTSRQSGMIAPLARIYRRDYTDSTSVKLQQGFNALNLSYAIMATQGHKTGRLSNRERSIIDHARNGRAVVVKGAGNDGVAVGTTNANRQFDQLNRELIGAASGIFVGALTSNGTRTRPARLASYSNIAGKNTTVQNQFLVVGVDGNKTGIYGTSFAAPIVSGYAAIVSSKFTRATPVQVRNQLLNTARKDTISGYRRGIHGRGEASIARALAPVSIR